MEQNFYQLFKDKLVELGYAEHKNTFDFVKFLTPQRYDSEWMYVTQNGEVGLGYSDLDEYGMSFYHVMIRTVETWGQFLKLHNAIFDL